VHSRVRKLYASAPLLLPRYKAIRALPLEERLKQPTFVLQLWLRQVARQVQVTALVQKWSDELQQSIEPFLVKRRGGEAPEETAERGDVFDRGR